MNEFKQAAYEGGGVASKPCRAAFQTTTPNVFTRGETVLVEYESNNRHAADVKFNDKFGKSY